MLEIVEHPIHLVEEPLLVLMLDAQLVAIGLADGAVGASPFIPNMTAQIGDAVGFFLPNPQHLIDGAFPIGAPQSHNGEFLRQVVAIHYAEFFDGMGWSAVRPMGPHLQIFIGKAVFQDIQAGCPVKLVRSAHNVSVLSDISDGIIP